MKAAAAIVFGALIIFIVFVGLPFMIYGTDFALYQYFAPKRAEVERKVFEQTKSYNQGMVQELQNMQFAYIKEKDPKAQEALASIILHRAADYPVESMPEDLRKFISDLKNKQSN